MVFSDPVFLLLFLPIAALLILLCARVAHSSAILAVSLLFYFWSSGVIVFVLGFSILFNWCLALLVQQRKSRTLLAAGITINLLILGYYKYAFFFAAQFDGLFAGNLSGTFENVILPIGISFFTFQAISYLVDVYKGDAAAEPNPIRFGAYLSFFPQLIAGPIVRFKDVIAQYLKPQITIANTSADMAIGVGLIFGIRFNENFIYPYSASSITEFWRRWHISLSSWYRDYLYIPLGGNRSSNLATYRNLLIVFAVTGLWHGAARTSVLWGFYHGMCLLVERLTRIPGRTLILHDSL